MNCRFICKRRWRTELSRSEIVATITQLAFYSGWPPAMTALRIARTVFADIDKGE